MSAISGSNVVAPNRVTIDAPSGESLQDFYIDIDGIAGESQDTAHSGQIDVLSWGIAASQSSSVASGGGLTTGKTHFSELVFTHYVDKASANLLKYCASGKHIGKAELTCCKAGDGQQEYMKITLKDVIVSHVGTRGSTDNARVLEEIGLSYAEILVEVKEQNNDGSMGAAVQGGYNIKTNTVI